MCQSMALRVGGGRRGKRLVANVEVIRVMYRLEARLDVLKVIEERGPSDISEDEDPRGEAVAATQEPAEMRMLRQILGFTSRPKPDIPNYSGNFNPEELIDWINDMEIVL